jgi:ABC-type polysaccharide/polyol phosphate export permease
MAGFVQAFRWCLLDEPLTPAHLAASVVSTILLFLAGTLYFRKVERRFSDIV